MNMPPKTFRDYDELVREARMQRSVAIAEAIATVIAAVSGAFGRLFGGVATGGQRPSEAQAHRT